MKRNGSDEEITKTVIITFCHEDHRVRLLTVSYLFSFFHEK